MKDERTEIENEKEILERAIRGEASAFGLLYNKYQPKLFRFIFLKVSQREEAEDLTHQVFLNAWQNIESFKDEGLPLSSWLYKIARNKVIDFYRTRKQISSIESIPDEILALSTKSSEEEISQKIQLESVYKALKKLPLDYQEVILMRFVEGLTPREIAKITGKNYGAVRVTQFRALKQLKNELKNYEA
jgi:RNA polymerase sigma-70 factor (ECF subfamily)